MERIICKECESPWVVNKKYCLCTNCNYKRLHGGKTQGQVIAERLAKAFIEPTAVQPVRPSASMYKQRIIKQRSSKGERQDAAMHAVYNKMASTQAMVCMCCGNNVVTHSHILPKSQYGMYRACPRNIVYMCITCHEVWEHGDLQAVEQLGNYPQILDIIQELYEIYFFRRFGEILADYRVEKKL